jgi:hypothetical protein
MQAAQLQARPIPLPGGRTAVGLVAPADVAGADAVAALGLRSPRALIVLNGGTTDLPADVRSDVQRSVGDGVARVAVEERLTVVTGGTDAGVFAVFGEALGDGQPIACVGVAPAKLVAWPGADEPGEARDLVPLEPHHTHFLLVRGEHWGVETDAMMALAATLADARPSIAVVAGGGTGAKREVLAHARAGREVIVLAGTGRLADELAAATERGGASDPDTAEAAASGLLTILDAEAAAASLADLLRFRLGLTGDRA